LLKFCLEKDWVALLNLRLGAGGQLLVDVWFAISSDRVSRTGNSASVVGFGWPLSVEDEAVGLVEVAGCAVLVDFEIVLFAFVASSCSSITGGVTLAVWQTCMVGFGVYKVFKGLMGL
jgi:hypothetical protein